MSVQYLMSRSSYAIAVDIGGRSDVELGGYAGLIETTTQTLLGDGVWVGWPSSSVVISAGVDAYFP